MGGWFTREVTSPEGFKGLRYRMAGPGAEVLRRMGAIVLMLPVGEIMTALKSGAIDASEWIGPWNDMALGLHEAASYYYYPGFHEPSAAQAVGINRAVWDSFDTSDRQVIEAVAASVYAISLAEYNANNALSLRKLRDRGHCQDPEIRRFPAEGLSRRPATKWLPSSVLAASFQRKSTRATSNSAHRSWIGAMSPNAPTSTADACLSYDVLERIWSSPA